MTPSVAEPTNLGADTSTIPSWRDCIRQLEAPGDAFCEHLLRLDQPSLQARFGNFVAPAFLAGYASRVDAANTLLIGCYPDGELRGVAELRSFEPRWADECEAAFSVEPAWQGRGIGTALMARSASEAHRLGVERIHVICDELNQRMKRMVSRVGGKLLLVEGECFGTIDVRGRPA